jgi:hypothetical protein
MQSITRRSLIKGTATAGGALTVTLDEGDRRTADVGRMAQPRGMWLAKEGSK